MTKLAMMVAAPGEAEGGGRHLSTFQFECFNYVTVTQFMQNLTIFKI